MIAKLVIFLTGTLSFFSYSQTWHLVTESFPPFIISENQQEPGWFNEIVLSALTAQNVDAQIEYTPWVRAVKLAQTSRKTAMIGAYYSNERSEHFYYSRPLAITHTGIFKRTQDTISFDGTIASLAPYTIAKSEENHISDQFRSAKKLAIVTTKTLNDSLWLLQNGRVDLVAGTKAVGEFIIKKDPNLIGPNLPALSYVEPHLAEQKMYLAFPRKDKNAVQNNPACKN